MNVVPGSVAVSARSPIPRTRGWASLTGLGTYGTAFCTAYRRIPGTDGVGVRSRNARGATPRTRGVQSQAGRARYVSAQQQCKAAARAGGRARGGKPLTSPSRAPHEPLTPASEASTVPLWLLNAWLMNSGCMMARAVMTWTVARAHHGMQHLGASRWMHPAHPAYTRRGFTVARCRRRPRLSYRRHAPAASARVQRVRAGTPGNDEGTCTRHATCTRRERTNLYTS